MLLTNYLMILRAVCLSSDLIGTNSFAVFIGHLAVILFSVMKVNFCCNFLFSFLLLLLFGDSSLQLEPVLVNSCC